MAVTTAANFSIHVVGDKTHETYRGDFSCKTMLSHGDELARDIRRRELLGVNPQFASDRQANQADILSEAYVRITKAPAWWNESRGGLDLYDDNVVAEVYKACTNEEKKVLAEIQKQADAAKEDLRKAPEG